MLRLYATIQFIRLSLLVHGFHEAAGAHVGPVCFDPIQTFAALTLRAHMVPAWRDFAEGGPKRVLAFIVHQHQKYSIFIFKWVGHHLSLHNLNSYKSSRIVPEPKP